MAMAMETESFAVRSGLRSVRSALLPGFATLQRHSFPNSTSLEPVFASCYGCGTGMVGGVGGMRSFASSTNPPEVKGFKDYKLPPVNPPEKENPDAVTLRAQWDNAVRLYGRMYSHAWGTAIMAGVALFGIGWWVKGENPLNALSPTGEIKKEETAD